MGRVIYKKMLKDMFYQHHNRYKKKRINTMLIVSFVSTYLRSPHAIKGTMVLLGPVNSFMPSYCKSNKGFAMVGV